MLVRTISNFFTNEDLAVILEDIDKVYKTSDLISSHDHWDHLVVEFSKEVKIHRLYEDDLSYNIIKNTLSRYYDAASYFVSYYFWEEGSYIPWHDDNSHEINITVYLNDMWDIRNGGLFQYIETNNEVKTIVPTMNQAVGLREGVHHSTTIMAENAPVRRTIQIRMKSKKTI